MKQNLITRTAVAATFSLVALCASIAVAGNIPEEISPGEIGFQISLPELLPLCNDSAIEYKYSSGEYIQKLLAEKTVFREETRPLLQDLRRKWADLAEELADSMTEASRVVLLQKEISALDAQLTQKRLKHMMALNEI